MKMLLRYIRQRKKVIVTFSGCCVIYAVTFYLFNIPMSAVLYPTVICTVLGIVLFVIDFIKATEKHRELEILKTMSYQMINHLPETVRIEETDYGEIIMNLCREASEIDSNWEEKYHRTTEYYSVWAHQIKTPISAMRLTLQNEDSEMSRQLMSDLIRIEQYVDMVMVYLRLDSRTSDYVFEKYDLDEIIKSVVKRLSPEFIRRKLSLDFKNTDTVIVTDDKWLSIVIEQILTNSLKYTKTGSISISYSEGKLIISDTGIGIAAEDLPRVFDKSFTGYNGRADKKASGIGLYLCKRICSGLGIEISIFSCEGSGTEVTLDFGNKYKL